MPKKKSKTENKVKIFELWGTATSGAVRVRMRKHPDGRFEIISSEFMEGGPPFVYFQRYIEISRRKEN